MTTTEEKKSKRKAPAKSKAKAKAPTEAQIARVEGWLPLKPRWLIGELATSGGLSRAVVEQIVGQLSEAGKVTTRVFGSGLVFISLPGRWTRAAVLKILKNFTKPINIDEFVNAANTREDIDELVAELVADELAHLAIASDGTVSIAEGRGTERTADPDLGELLEIDPELLRDSPFQPRRAMRESGLEELTASIRAVGVLQPPLVRAIDVGYEIILGHRRRVAAVRAGLKVIEVRVISRKLSDQEIREMQLAENAIRDDLSPLDEAHAYDELFILLGSVEAVADRIGRSADLIRRRMSLLCLSDAWQRLLAADKMSLGAAQAIASLGEVEQRELMSLHKNEASQMEISTYGCDPGPRVSALWVRIALRNLETKLTVAPFDINDPDLLPAAGACGSCPKRSGAQPDLFGLMPKFDGDRCLDLACWKKKGEIADAKLCKLAGATTVTVVESWGGWEPAPADDLPIEEATGQRLQRHVVRVGAGTASIAVKGAEHRALIQEKAAKDSQARTEKARLADESRRTAADQKAPPQPAHEPTRQEQWDAIETRLEAMATERAEAKSETKSARGLEDFDWIGGELRRAPVTDLDLLRLAVLALMPHVNEAGGVDLPDLLSDLALQTAPSRFDRGNLAEILANVATESQRISVHDELEREVIEELVGRLELKKSA